MKASLIEMDDFGLGPSEAATFISVQMDCALAGKYLKFNNLINILVVWYLLPHNLVHLLAQHVHLDSTWSH